MSRKSNKLIGSSFQGTIHVVDSSFETEVNALLDELKTSYQNKTGQARDSIKIKTEKLFSISLHICNEKLEDKCRYKGVCFGPCHKLALTCGEEENSPYYLEEKS